MKILEQIGTVGLIIVVLPLIIGFFLPSKRHLKRSITINAPVGIIFEEVNNLKKWQNWSPWQNIDTNTTIIYEGSEAGVGSTMTWASKHPQVGKGSQKIVVSNPNRCIITSLEFVDWSDSVTTTDWKFEQQTADETQVTWSHDSDNKGKLLYKYMDILIYFKLGKSYSQGLQNLKEYVERIYQQQQDTQEEKVSRNS